VFQPLRLSLESRPSSATSGAGPPRFARTMGTKYSGVLAEWSKALASGASGATRAGSNPADVSIVFCFCFLLLDCFVDWDAVG
jgi:hypothetical protein